MADRTKIEWTDATWNPITGCSVVSPGCTNCYAMQLAGTRLKHTPSRKGLTSPSKAGPVWNGQVRFNREWLEQPLRWKRPRMVFVCAHGDLFHESVPDEWIDQIFAVMALCPEHTFQVLTKRARRMREYLHIREHQIVAASLKLPRALTRWPHLPLPNVWLGVSVEDQTRAVERIPDLLQARAAVRFVSAEPLLGPLDLTSMEVGEGTINALNPTPWAEELENWRDTEEEWEESFLNWYYLDTIPTKGDMYPTLDWVIAGGESGSAARPMHPEWVRSLRDQCAASEAAFFFKQWGEWTTAAGAPASQHIGHVFDDGFQMIRMGKKASGRTLDGCEHNEMPQPREVPAL
ncbi:DUF5131 family protein [Nitratireductor aquimarinus]|uniref:DUF5131 family protein n=1 Tax=Nitratireductor aquimarinus TaxID=889300 RepID=UPI00398F493E